MWLLGFEKFVVKFWFFEWGGINFVDKKIKNWVCIWVWCLMLCLHVFVLGVVYFIKIWLVKSSLF